MPDQISHYLLFEQIGAGGIGTIYRAQDEANGAAVAIKLLHPHLASDPEYVSRFQREATVAQNLDSPYVIGVLDSGQDGESYFLVMELEAGQTLANLMQERGRLPIGDVRTAATAIANALAAANSAGIVHGGISPQNVMITENGEVKVMGFGVSRELGEPAATTRLQQGGKPFYTAPEASDDSPVDVRADIYALGVTLFEMLTGTVPFDAWTPDGGLRIPNVVQLRPETPAWLAAIMYRCLARDPAKRYQSPDEVLAALALADNPQPEAAPVELNPMATGRPASVSLPWQEGLAERGIGNWARRNRLWLGSAAGGLLILGVYGGLSLGSSFQGGESAIALPPTSTPTDAETVPTATPTSTTAVAGVPPLLPPASTDLPEAQVVPAPTSTTEAQASATSTAVPSQPTSAAVDPTATSTPVPPPTATVAAVDCGTLATVSDTAPRVGSTQTATGQFSCSGRTVSGVPMAALFSFGTSTAKCTSTSDDQGIARCSLTLEAATPGQFVSVSVCFAFQGSGYCRQTGFTVQ